MLVLIGIYAFRGYFAIVTQPCFPRTMNERATVCYLPDSFDQLTVRSEEDEGPRRLTGQEEEPIWVPAT